MSAYCRGCGKVHEEDDRRLCAACESLRTVDGKQIKPGRDAVWPRSYAMTRDLRLIGHVWMAAWDDEDGKGDRVEELTPVSECWSSEAAAQEAERIGADVAEMGPAAEALDAEIESLGGGSAGLIGSLEDAETGRPLRFFGYTLNGWGLIVGDDGEDAGLYVFHPPNGAPVEHDLAMIVRLADTDPGTCSSMFFSPDGDDVDLTIVELMHQASELKERAEKAEARVAELEAAALPDSPTSPFVMKMARFMEQKLDENRHKGDSAGWQNSGALELMYRVTEELEELLQEVDKPGIGMIHDNVWREAADVANMAMMVADSACQEIPVAVTNATPTTGCDR